MFTPADEIVALDVLVVEDDRGYALLMTEFLSEHAPARSVGVVRDGMQALKLLRSPERPLPRLLILDLHLPGMDGLELLARIKGDERLKSITTVVMSGSDDPADERHAYDRHADEYLTKPTDLDSLIAAVHSFDRYFPEVADAVDANTGTDAVSGDGDGDGDGDGADAATETTLD